MRPGHGGRLTHGRQGAGAGQGASREAGRGRGKGRRASAALPQTMKTRDWVGSSGPGPHDMLASDMAGGAGGPGGWGGAGGRGARGRPSATIAAGRPGPAPAPASPPRSGPPPQPSPSFRCPPAELCFYFVFRYSPSAPARARGLHACVCVFRHLSVRLPLLLVMYQRLYQRGNPQPHTTTLTAFGCCCGTAASALLAASLVTYIWEKGFLFVAAKEPFLYTGLRPVPYLLTGLFVDQKKRSFFPRFVIGSTRSPQLLALKSLCDSPAHAVVLITGRAGPAHGPRPRTQCRLVKTNRIVCVY